jgi:LacI family transcriptional regulator
MKQIVEHLAIKGAKSAAFITSTKGSSSGLLRQKYVLSHAKKNNIQIRPDLILDGDFSVEWGVKATNLICQKDILPDAIICSDDVIALGVLSQLLKLNKKVPQEILVTGLDNVSFTNLFFPTLTTLAQPLDAIAETALNLLLGHNQTDKSKNQIAHKGTLIVRESTSSQIIL